MIPGLDVSQMQGAVNWTAVAAAGYRFAYLRCGVGNDPMDSRYNANVRAARAAGLAIGPYMFAYPLPHLDPVDQAHAHFAMAEGLGTQAGDLPAALDFEWPDPAAWAAKGCSSDQLRSWALDYLREAQALFGVPPAFYSFPWFLSELAVSVSPAFGSFPLWLADYTVYPHTVPPDGAGPRAEPPWAGWSIWQHSGGGLHLPGTGVAVDGNVIANEDMFARLLSRPGMPEAA